MAGAPCDDVLELGQSGLGQQGPEHVHARFSVADISIGGRANGTAQSSGQKNPLTEARGFHNLATEGSDLQASASLELHNVLGSDFDFSTGLWVAASTCSAVADRERTETNERNTVTALEGTVDCASSGVESACSVSL